MKRKIYILLLLLPFAVSCNKFLDEMPDNRAELDSEEKIGKMLVSAYSTTGYIKCSEISSDNLDYYSGETNPYGSRFLDELFFWKDGKEGDNESPSYLWESCYGAIASANQALAAIEEMGNPESLNPFKGEALMCRAYAHFVLTNVFCMHYSPEHSDKDLGIPYMGQSETELNPKYERPTVAYVYEQMAKDIEEGLPLINDAVFGIPKYHFNKNAAYAFAARFFLYYQQWDKVIKYATEAVGPAPETMLRNNAQLELIRGQSLASVVSVEYVSAAHKCNYLMLTGYSDLGTIFGNYYSGSRYSHGRKIAETETLLSTGPWGSYVSNTATPALNTYYLRPFIYGGTNLDKVLLPRLPYIFEYTDPVAGIGYSRTVYTAFTAEEALLCRAEAYILKKDYGKAMEDIKLWVNNTIRAGANLVTQASIEAWADSYAYYTPTSPTPKKRLKPDFTVESGTQEKMLQFLLYIRRQETLFTGLRWFDTKRYGITVHRRLILSGNIDSVLDSLPKRDPRCAIQIPYDVVAAGITPNPRNENK
jgi:hypothetical protein